MPSPPPDWLKVGKWCVYMRSWWFWKCSQCLKKYQTHIFQSLTGHPSHCRQFWYPRSRWPSQLQGSISSFAPRRWFWNPPWNYRWLTSSDSIPGSGRFPGEGHGIPLQYSCLESPRVEEPDRCSPWGHKELDMTECLSTMQGAQLMSVTT